MFKVDKIVKSYNVMDLNHDVGQCLCVLAYEGGVDKVGVVKDNQIFVRQALILINEKLEQDTCEAMDTCLTVEDLTKVKKTLEEASNLGISIIKC